MVCLGVKAWRWRETLVTPLRWMPHFLSLFFRSLRGQLALWFGGLSLLTLLSVGLYVGRLATQQVATTAGASIHATARAAADKWPRP